MINRRRFIKQSIAATSASFCGLPNTVFAKNNKKPLVDLHEHIIDCVKKLAPAEPLTLTLLYPQGSYSNLKPIIQSFAGATGINITPLEVGVDDINSTIIFNTAQDKYLFDIALPASFSLHELAGAGALYPLTKYQQKYEPSDYSENQLYNLSDTVGDTFYGYQTDGDAYLMFYNKAMLDDKTNQENFRAHFGYSLGVPQSWQQLDQMIEFFHQPEKQQYGGCLFRIPGYGAWEWWSRFHAKGFYPLSDNLEPQINNAAGIQALEEMIKVSKFLHPNTASDGLFENWATFSEGQTFCNIGWGGSQKAFIRDTSKVKDNLYYSPAPGGTIGEQSFNCPIFNWGWNYVVSSRCPQAEIAYLFTLYACSPVMSTLSVRQDGFFDPYRKEHYGDQAIQDLYTPEFLTAHQTSMNESIPDFYINKQSAYLSALQENITLAYKGNITAKQALDLTAIEWEKLNSQGNTQQQQQAWLALKAKYPKNLKQILR